MKIKTKYTLILILFFTFSTSLHAQTFRSIGVQSGINFSYISLPYEQYTVTLITGFMGGVQIEMQLSDLMSFNPQLLYVRKGFKYVLVDYNLTPIPAIVNIDQELDYIQIPLIMTFKVGVHSIHPFVFAGPDVGVKIGNRSKGTVDYRPDPELDNREIEPFDLAFDGGAGLEIPINQQLAITGSVRYSFGFTTLVKDYTSSWKSRCIQVLAGVNLSL